jgi:hypothetical protein
MHAGTYLRKAVKSLLLASALQVRPPARVSHYQGRGEVSFIYDDRPVKLDFPVFRFELELYFHLCLVPNTGFPGSEHRRGSRLAPY